MGRDLQAVSDAYWMPDQANGRLAALAAISLPAFRTARSLIGQLATIVIEQLFGPFRPGREWLHQACTDLATRLLWLGLSAEQPQEHMWPPEDNLIE
jgi:hypothetical protein